MTDPRPVDFWVAELGNATRTVAQQGPVTIRTERRVGGGTVSEEHVSTEKWQAAADRARMLTSYLNGQQQRMTEAERRAFYTANLRHHETLLHFAKKDDREEVEANIATLRRALGQ
jgi:DNA topoisomerase VI subunit B